MVTGSIFGMTGIGGLVVIDVANTGGNVSYAGGILLDPASDETAVDNVQKYNIPDQAWVSSMTEAYPVDAQSSQSPTAMLYAINQMLSEFIRTDTTISVKKRDGTEAFQIELDSATAPTSATQSS